MSNLVYDYLTESILFKDIESKYSDIPIRDLINELNDYKNYIDQNYDKIKEESIDETLEFSLTAPISLYPENMSTNEVLNGALFLDRYFIDDPIYSLNFDDLENLNYGLSLHNANPLSENDIKNSICKAAYFLKEITPLVRTGVEYIKILPFTKKVIERNLKSLNFPDLSLDHIDQRTIEWMRSRLKLYKNVNNQLQPLDEITNNISLMFEHDKVIFSAVYGEMRPALYDNHGNAIKLTPFPVLPDNEKFKYWISEEIIKAIRDKYKHILLYHSVANEFNTTTGLSSKFDQELLSFLFEHNGLPAMYDLGLNLDIPFIDSGKISKIAEVREKANEAIVNFRVQLRNDSQTISLLTDKNEIKQITKELSKSYQDHSQDLKKQIYNSFKKSELIPDIAILTATFLSVPPIYREIIIGSTIIQRIMSYRNSHKNSPYLIFHKLCNNGFAGHRSGCRK